MAEILSPDQVLDAVGEWSLLQVNEFVKKFEEKFDVSAAAAPVALAAGVPGGEAAAPAAEQTEFTLVLKSAGAQKIKVIKEVRTLMPDLGLKEAKELVDASPKELLKDVSKEEAEKAKKALEAVGAEVEVK